ncbi:MAG: polyamine aminopropyltransferase [Bacteroidetes bacterium]|nr:polyamine aminopropyltransferase [Bacteroidota bacterium]
MQALGRHILVEYFDCRNELLNDVPYIEQSMVAAARKADATVINSTFHHFSPFGVSGVVVIQESHLAIHTWPEYGYAAVDLFTCGDTVDPWIAYNELKRLLEAGSGSSIEMLRGQLGLIPGTRQEMEAHREDHAVQLGKPANGYSPGEQATSLAPKYSRNVWFTERSENTAHSFRHTGKQLYREQSPFQLVEVYDTYAWGKTLTLDRMVMTTEKDEFIYHEMIAHVGLFSHPNPKRVLVIGGGDGGAVREILRHEGLEKVVMVEIDEKVIEASKLHLPAISSAFDHPKLELIVGDGIAYVEESMDDAFDLVLVDSTDPVGPGEGLFTERFYRHVHRILRPGGIQITQSESPHYAPALFREIYACYRQVFGNEHVHCYLAHIPTYPSGMWSFSWAMKGEGHPFNGLDRNRIDAFCRQHGLKYYNADIHQGAFCLPTFTREMVENDPKVEATAAASELTAS